MDDKELKEILEAHKKWLSGNGGERANLAGANLAGADLRCAALADANLAGARLRGATLVDADLAGATLRGATLVDANIRGAYLGGANLAGADLAGADIRGAYLGGANLACATLSEKIVQVGPIGSRKNYTIYHVDFDVVKCGCWNNFSGGTLEEFKARVDYVYPTGQYRQEYLAAIAMFEALKKARDADAEE